VDVFGLFYSVWFDFIGNISPKFCIVVVITIMCFESSDMFHMLKYIYFSFKLSSLKGEKFRLIMSVLLSTCHHRKQPLKFDCFTGYIFAFWLIYRLVMASEHWCDEVTVCDQLWWNSKFCNPPPPPHTHKIFVRLEGIHFDARASWWIKRRFQTTELAASIILRIPLLAARSFVIPLQLSYFNVRRPTIHSPTAANKASPVVK
jgi:hypothetical protein